MFTQSNVWCRKKGWSTKVESLPCQWQQVREDGRVYGAPCWAGTVLHGQGLFGRKEGAAAASLLPQQGVTPVSVAPPEWVLLVSPGHWHPESTSVSSHEAAGAFWWLLNLFCFHYLSKPGKFLNSTNVPQVLKASWVSLCWVIAWVFVACGGCCIDTPGPKYLELPIWIQAEGQTDWDQLCWQGPGGSGGIKAVHKQAICAGSPETPMSWGSSPVVWAADGGDSSPLLLGPCLVFCLQVWAPQCDEHVELLYWVQKRPQKCFKGWSTSAMYDRLRELGLFSLEKSRLWGDLTATYII